MRIELETYDAVAFNFDGTLADSTGVHDKARSRAFAEHGLGRIPLETHALAHTYGVRSSTIISSLLKATGEIESDADSKTHPLVTALTERKQELCMQAAKRGVTAQVEALPHAKLFATCYAGRVAIVTTAARGEVRPFLERHGLEKVFRSDLLITDESIVQRDLQPKPAPDAYELAIERLEIADPARLLVVESTPVGVESAKKAGATVLALGLITSETSFATMPGRFQPDYFEHEWGAVTMNGEL